MSDDESQSERNFTREQAIFLTNQDNSSSSAETQLEQMEAGAKKKLEVCTRLVCTLRSNHASWVAGAQHGLVRILPKETI